MFEDLIREIKNGEIKRDILTEDNDFEFSGEPQAMYFSRLRRFMSSETAYKIMNGFQDNNNSLMLLNAIKA